MVRGKDAYKAAGLRRVTDGEDARVDADGADPPGPERRRRSCCCGYAASMRAKVPSQYDISNWYHSAPTCP
jgi:hypothetical protein